MAQTQAEIEADIIAAKNADANLAGLTSPSLVAKWRLWIKIISAAIKQLQDLWDTKLEDLNAAADAAVSGNDKWYASRMFDWQYGHALFESNGKLIYLVPDEAAKIVNKVAVQTVNRLIYIKVAKGSPLQKLSAAEITALDDYIKQIKFAGSQHVLVSTDPDLIKLTATVYYNGQLDLSTFKTAFELALNTYLTNIFFNGNFNINKFRDAGEAVEGTEDFQIASVEIKPDTGAYLPVTLNYNPASGYFKIDPAYPLATQITYIPV